jgi:hypothetical protein
MFGRAERVQRGQSWGRLYVVAVLMLAIFGVVEAYAPEGAWRRTLEMGVTLIGFGTMHLWVRSNRRAFDLAGQQDPGFRRLVEASRGPEPMGRRWGGGAPSPHEATAKSSPSQNGRPGTVVALPRPRVVGGSDRPAKRGQG